MRILKIPSTKKQIPMTKELGVSAAAGQKNGQFNRERNFKKA
jgi:hypothetical protein